MITYSVRKQDIFNYYKHFDKIDVDNIQDVNDHIIDVDLGKDSFDNLDEEFYNTLSMCIYMIENDLYDEYFFELFKLLLDEYKIEENNDKDLIEKDIEIVKDYLKKDEIKSNYYDKLSEVYDKK